MSDLDDETAVDGVDEVVNERDAGSAAARRLTDESLAERSNGGSTEQEPTGGHHPTGGESDTSFAGAAAAWGPWGAWGVAVSCTLMVLVAAASLFWMEARGADFDPQYMRTVVERTIRFGGSYYENAVHNKGPLEPFLYEIARRVGGFDGFWFMIALLSLAAACCVGAAAHVVTRLAGGPAVIGASVAAGTIVHFTLSGADYAGVLYARNITVALLCVIVVIAGTDACWTTGRRRIASAAGCGVLAGLAVQTLLTTVFAGSVVLLWVVWRRGRLETPRSRAGVWIVIGGAVGLVSAPIWYLLRGSWRDFVDGWWVYARFMSEATDRSLADQGRLGWDSLFEYYRERPEVVVFVVLWGVVTLVRWHRLDGAQRALRLMIGAWFAAAWVELILSQRYSSHYFAVLAVPTLLMLADLVGQATARLARTGATHPILAWMPALAIVLSLQIGALEGLRVGVESMWAVQSTEEFTERRESGYSGRSHTMRATLDAVSDEQDPILAWTSYPWTYIDLHRTSATRYIWKTFLLGEIYLGRTSEEFVLDGTWDRFADDLAESDPVAFVVESGNPVDESTPFADVVESDFTPVWEDGDGTLSFRNDVAEWLEPNTAGTPVDLADGDLIATDEPVRLDAGLDPVVPVVEIGLTGTGGVDASLTINRTNGSVDVDSWRSGVANWVRNVPAPPDAGVTIIVADDAVLMAIDGVVAGAVSREPVTAVWITTGADALLDPVESSAEPPGSGG
ncbi:hypothetical protein BDK89_1908 [Ilumatobacter fluminis]|uniref:4-amino-4-deoxy-L-arabinose transferase-like glycosyltransferase n=1 Tax=Ilumatobacter fluminis TaxID=467091 RepID=A0A4R7HZX3_9ACTN|nr:hypothetical protein [Ilumatobacter fluminis]TDT16324.1 hypothetical protein BDK89_1908 [Ilumatobacter fluminis]